MLAESNLFEKIPCALCGGQDFKVLKPSAYPKELDRQHLLSLYKSSSEAKLLDQLVKCEHCQMVQISPRVHQEIILSSYSGAIDPKFIEQDTWRIKTFSRSLKKICKTLNISPSKNIKVLDIGCAGGAFPKEASDAGFSVIGVEPSRWLCVEGKKRYHLDLRPGILEEQEFEPLSFDIITLWDVIEHLTDPEKTMAKIKTLLKPNGALVVNYPDYGSWQAKIFGKRWPFLLSVHLYYFTPQTISNFFKKCSFEIIETRPHRQSLGLGYVLERASGYFSIFKLFYKISKILKIENLPFVYNIGQTQVIARVKK